MMYHKSQNSYSCTQLSFIKCKNVAKWVWIDKRKKEGKKQRNDDKAGTGYSGSSANDNIPARIIQLDAGGNSALSFKV